MYANEAQRVQTCIHTSKSIKIWDMKKEKNNPFVQYYTKFEQITTTATSIFKRMFHKSLFEISLP